MHRFHGRNICLIIGGPLHVTITLDVPSNANGDQLRPITLFLMVPPFTIISTATLK